MPEEHQLTLRQADQVRTDIANVESGIEMIMAQLARLPTRKEQALNRFTSCSAAPGSSSSGSSFSTASACKVSACRDAPADAPENSQSPTSEQ
jgi:hypothetical protein